MLYKSKFEFENRRTEIIKRLNKNGIKVKKSERSRLNGRFSGIIGSEGKVLRINIPKWEKFN